MADVILTGASRGIGRALALRVASTGRASRMVLVARDRTRLESLVADIERLGGRAIAVCGDLSSLAGAEALGRQLSGIVNRDTTLIHNAGLWPSKRVLTPDGLESAFVVNHLAPLRMQESLIAAGQVRRVLVIGAGLMIKGRFDRGRTPTGEDFSSLRTYCNTKLCFALAMRDIAAVHPELDVLVVHLGVVRTDLGARRGPIGWVLWLVKQFWERPEVSAERLYRILAKDRWSPPGDALWFFEDKEQPWPAVACNEDTRAQYVRLRNDCSVRITPEP
jgi:NAD(P)-dependent dehydrogenase (short-subunit alcohol dehydrogenase family)